MKKLIITVLMIVSPLTAFASGKITLQNNFYEDNVYRPMLSLSAYEKITKNIHFNGWLGGGVSPMETSDDIKWMVTKAQVDVDFKSFTVSPGYQYKHLFGDSDTFSKDIHMGFFAVSKQLW